MAALVTWSERRVIRKQANGLSAALIAGGAGLRAGCFARPGRSRGGIMKKWPFEPLNMFTYDVIVADPPWRFDNWSKKGEGKNAVSHYNCMSIEDIKALPVGDLATQNAILVLWATNPMLDRAFEVMKAWNFKFKTAGTWVKLTTNEKLAFGTGYILRSANEPFLIGTIGKPGFSNSVRSVCAGTREHSRKPDEMIDMVEVLAGAHTKKLELFSRTDRPGWDAWGDEIGKFENG